MSASWPRFIFSLLALWLLISSNAASQPHEPSRTQIKLEAILFKLVGTDIDQSEINIQLLRDMGIVSAGDTCQATNANRLGMKNIICAAQSLAAEFLEGTGYMDEGNGLRFILIPRENTISIHRIKDIMDKAGWHYYHRNNASIEDHILADCARGSSSSVAFANDRRVHLPEKFTLKQFWMRLNLSQNEGVCKMERVELNFSISRRNTF